MVVREGRARCRRLDPGGREVVPAGPGAEGHHRGRAPLGHGPHAAIVPVEHGQAVGGQVGQEGRLLPGHAVDVAQGHQVGHAHGGHHPHLGWGHGTHGVDLAEVSGGHLHHGHLVLGPETAEGHGQAEPAAEVAGGAEHAEAGGQDVGHQFLRPGLAHRARDRHHPGCPGPHHVGPVTLHGRHRVVDHQRRAPVGHARRVVDQHGIRPARPRLGHEVVAVAPRRAHGHEQVARLGQPRVEAEALVAGLGGRSAHLQSPAPHPTGRRGGSPARHLLPQPARGVRSAPARRPARSIPASTIRWSTAQGGSGSASASHCE